MRLLLLLNFCIAATLAICPKGSSSTGTEFCRGVSFSPYEKVCCGHKLFDIPGKTHAQCCNGKAYWRNETKPDSCMAQGCDGTGTRHSGTELCCGDRTVWVGSDARCRMCCGTTVIDRSKYLCCVHPNAEASTPYHKATMECQPDTKTVTLKKSHKFDTSSICKNILNEWDATFPIPRVENGSHFHIRGLPLPCTTDLKTRNKTPKYGIISLSPYVTTAELPKACQGGDTINVAFRLKANDSCSMEDFQDTFQSVVVDVFFKRISNIRCRKGVPTLRLKTGYNAVLLTTKHPDALLRQSLMASGNH